MSKYWFLYLRKDFKKPETDIPDRHAVLCDAKTGNLYLCRTYQENDKYHETAEGINYDPPFMAIKDKKMLVFYDYGYTCPMFVPEKRPIFNDLTDTEWQNVLDAFGRFTNKLLDSITWPLPERERDRDLTQALQRSSNTFGRRSAGLFEPEFIIPVTAATKKPILTDEEKAARKLAAKAAAEAAIALSRKYHFGEPAAPEQPPKTDPAQATDSTITSEAPEPVKRTYHICPGGKSGIGFFI